MCSSEDVIRTEGIRKEYFRVKPMSGLLLHPFKRETILALENINIEIKKSELVCLFGANGAGKTTLLRILSGILLPSKGEIYINGAKVNNLGKLKEKVSCEFGDERSFYWRLTAKENLEFFGALYGINSKQLEERLNVLFAFFEIGDPNRRFYEYSSGLKQRFCIIRGLINNPDVLLLDEPTKSLDFIAREKLLSFVKNRFFEVGRKTIIISTNYLDSLGDIEIYDKIIILHKGKIMAQGNIEKIKIILGISNLNNKEITNLVCGLKT